MEEEIWKDIPEFEGFYQVSNLGNVKSFKKGKELILKKSINKGRYAVCFYHNKKAVVKKVHKLVAIAFLNHIPDGMKTIVDHIDNNPLNDRADNLRLTNNRDNVSKDKRGYTSDYVGVCWNKKYNKWMAQIRIGKKSKFLGYFLDELKASEAYKKALSGLVNEL
jgi:hypothetical protein